MTDELLEWRREFPILERTTYLISHSLGAMPRQTFERLQSYAETWATRGVRAWAEGWWDMPLTVGDEVGRIIGAPAGTTVMHQNVSVCMSVILSCFDTTPDTRRNKVVYSELEFPSVMYAYEAHARDGRFRIERSNPTTESLSRSNACSRRLTKRLFSSLSRTYSSRAPLFRTRAP